MFSSIKATSLNKINILVYFYLEGKIKLIQNKELKMRFWLFTMWMPPSLGKVEKNQGIDLEYMLGITKYMDLIVENLEILPELLILITVLLFRNQKLTNYFKLYPKPIWIKISIYFIISCLICLKFSGIIYLRISIRKTSIQIQKSISMVHNIQ